MKILVLNAGSSSHKTCLYELGESVSHKAPAPVWQAEVDWNGVNGESKLTVKSTHEPAAVRKLNSRKRNAAIREALGLLVRPGDMSQTERPKISVVGHRVVHGGRDYHEPTVITEQVKSAISRLAVFAPLHNPAALEGIEAVEQLLPGVLQVAAFDTAFHHTLPEEARTYPGPYEWLREGILRYGFHGINHEYCSGRAAQILGRSLGALRIIVCHLGNGCSLAAVREGRSVDTTMGLTPLEGLMMGTRSGSVDPGILLYLLQHNSTSPDELDRVLNHRSGLLGISGLSSDMRDILKAMGEGNSRARLAFDMFVHRLRLFIGAMAASLGGVDVLVFTGGIGENSPAVRAAACKGLEFLGLRLDESTNEGLSGDRDIACDSSKGRVLVVRANEDFAIAAKCRTVARSRPHTS
ncbi:MAG: acetate/propionate family kinase [Terriglobia bacterium]